MNLYNLHEHPETLTGYDQRFLVPKVAFDEALQNFEKTGKRSYDIEPFFANDPECAYAYAALIKERFELGEPSILKRPFDAYRYAELVIDGRWQEAELIIATDRFSAYWYARNIIQGRWLEGEPAIATDAYWSYLYARDVVKGKFSEGESVIKRDEYWWRFYVQLCKGNPDHSNHLATNLYVKQPTN